MLVTKVSGLLKGRGGGKTRVWFVWKLVFNCDRVVLVCEVVVFWSIGICCRKFKEGWTFAFLGFFSNFKSLRKARGEITFLVRN